MKNQRVVEVVWIDAQSSLSQITLEQAKKQFSPKKVRTVGYLLNETKDYLLIGFVCFGDSYKHWQLIPKCLVVKRNFL